MLELELFNTTLAILVTEESFADSSASLKVAVFLSAAIIAPLPSQPDTAVSPQPCLTNV